MIRLGAGGSAALAVGILTAVGLFLVWFADLHHDRGVEAERARNRAAIDAVNAELAEVAEASARRAREIKELKLERAELSAELDEVARDAPDSDRPGIDPDGWLRIRRAWD